MFGDLGEFKSFSLKYLGCIFTPCADAVAFRKHGLFYHAFGGKDKRFCGLKSF